MSINIKNIEDFSNFSAPKGADALPSPQNFITGDIQNKNFGFLIQLSLEGSSILDGKSSLDRTGKILDAPIKFTWGDIRGLNAGCALIAGIRQKKIENLSEIQEKTLTNTLTCLMNLAGHYREATKIMESKKQEANNTNSQMGNDFVYVCLNRDFTALAKLYPDHEIYQDTGKKPAKEDMGEGISSLLPRIQERKKAECLAKLFGKPLLTPDTVTNRLGSLPPQIEKHERTVKTIYEIHEKLLNISKATEKLIQSFQDSLFPPAAPVSLQEVRAIRAKQLHPPTGEQQARDEATYAFPIDRQP